MVLEVHVLNPLAGLEVLLSRSLSYAMRGTHLRNHWRVSMVVESFLCP